MSIPSASSVEGFMVCTMPIVDCFVLHLIRMVPAAYDTYVVRGKHRAEMQIK